VSTLLTPGVYFERRTTPPRIPSVRTDVAAFVGLAERGPLRMPARVRSWEEFRSTFGGFVSYGYLAYAVRAFFENGGRVCYIVRVAAPEAAAATATVVDGTGAPAFAIRASNEGSWGNRLEVELVRSSPAATRTAAGQQPVDPASSRVDGVTGFRRGSFVRIAQDGAPTTYRVVDSVDAVANLILWDTALDAAYDPEQRLSLETVEWSLRVRVGGFVRGVLRDFAHGSRSVIPAHDDAGLVLVEDVRTTPAPASADLHPSTLSLGGGVDGLPHLLPSDYIAGLDALEPVDEVAIVAVPDALVQPQLPPSLEPQPEPPYDECTPGDTPAPAAVPLQAAVSEQPPRFSFDNAFAVQQALVEHCEKLRDRIALIDPPTLDADIGDVQSWRQRFDSSYAALYYPWTLVYDPLHLAGAVVRAIPPSGHVAGVYARTDLGPGVHAAPANVELQWAQGSTADVSAELQESLNPNGINCIRAFPGRGIRVFGARTVSSDPSWRFVNVRRLLMAIEKSVARGVQWSAFEPADVYLRQKLAMSISGLLERIWERGAFAGPTTQTSYFVKSDDDNNPPSIVDAGEVVVDVGVAAVKPAEFVVFRVSRIENELEIVE
jgi:Bacteriophage tail sheath protein